MSEDTAASGEPAAIPRDFVLQPPSTLVIVRGGLRHFFWRWSEVLAFARPGDTVNLFAGKQEREGFWKQLTHLEETGPTPPEMHVLCHDEWTLEQVYGHVHEPLPEGPRSSVRDILSLLRLHRDIDGPVFQLDERNPDRY